MSQVPVVETEYTSILNGGRGVRLSPFFHAVSSLQQTTMNGNADEVDNFALSDAGPDPTIAEGKGFDLSGQFSDGFSEHVSDSEDEDGQSLSTKSRNSLSAPQFTKLEVVGAQQIQRLMMGQRVVLVTIFIYTVIVSILAANVWLETRDKPGQWEGSIDFAILPDGLLWQNHLTSILTFLYSSALCAIFTIRIFRLKKQHRTHEQLWTVGLLIAVVLYQNPMREIQSIHDHLWNGPLGQADSWANGSKNWFSTMNFVTQTLKIAGFTAATVFYFWASVHSYRLLETEGMGISFYLPKVLTLSAYIGMKLCAAIQYRVNMADLFFASFFGMLHLNRTSGRWDYLPSNAFGIASLIFELLISAYILREVQTTKDVLKKADYVKYRTKQIGFRFLIYHNVVFYLIFWCLYMLLLVGVPNGIYEFVFLFAKEPEVVFSVSAIDSGIRIALSAYATVEAYANLPADALGFKGWFSPQGPSNPANQSTLEPITYRKREAPSLKGVVPDLKSNCFVMQTHVTMFNFAWLVYYWDTPKVDDFKLTQDVFKFSVAQFIKDKPTDTQVLVVDGADRIVIAFKGTTSMKNLQTDVNTFYSNARSLMPTMLGVEDEAGDVAANNNPMLKSNTWRFARVHKGFALAYAAIAPMLLSTVKRLQEERRRPVFITGHSLGGALSTICSLDLNLRLGLTPQEIFVSTFGAPRVGNRQFATFYDSIAPIHWRIVVGPDVVAKLPRIGFSHVGRKTLITVDGDLFIDPNSLELNLWSGDVASILYHRKASYLLAMRAWCERHHGDGYVPEFWPFPVSKDDTRRFEHAMVKSTGAPVSHGAGTKGTAPVSKRTRMRQMDAMINALEGPDGPNASPAAVDCWARLARGLLDEMYARHREYGAL